MPRRMPKRLPPVENAWCELPEITSVAMCPPVPPLKPVLSPPLDSSHVMMMMPFCRYQAEPMIAGMLLASHASPVATASFGQEAGGIIPLVCMSLHRLGLIHTKLGGDGLFRSLKALVYGTTLLHCDVEVMLL